jgi:tRNA(His) 5'-end guanylyltransferase
MGKPYDKKMSQLMRDVTVDLVKKFDALMGYTQSDEITLVWYFENPSAELPFGGRVFKINSILAATCTQLFNAHLPKYFPDRVSKAPVFDCRCWNAPTLEEGVNAFMWREWDATKNSILCAGQSVYSHKELQGSNTSQVQDLLMKKGINWNDYPAFFKRGTYVQRRTFGKIFSEEELSTLPARHEARKDPGKVFYRSVVEAIQLPPLAKVQNRCDVIFRRKAPISDWQGDTSTETL